ncbi:MAG TPA: RES family NAD+ phosphorylase [Verrucomicrobiae bacterium]|nr:RES family NAD+ phosphorylase [Verrucomicrobiae bacterium]
MSAAIHRHPRFAELRYLFRAHPEWFGPWNGTLFRFQTVDFPTTRNVLSGEGARWRGGRWNSPGIATLYGSTTDNTALGECKAHDHYYGVETRSPRLLVAIEARLTRMLDLTMAGTRRAMNVTLAELRSEDWRKLQAAGKESFTQAIGRAVVAAGGSGLLSHSATVKRGVNVAIFPGVCTADHVEVVDGAKLENWASKRKRKK